MTLDEAKAILDEAKANVKRINEGEILVEGILTVIELEAILILMKESTN